MNDVTKTNQTFQKVATSGRRYCREAFIVFLIQCDTYRNDMNGNGASCYHFVNSISYIL